MFKSAQVLASTTLLCGVLALSGCGASQAGQGAEDTSAHPSASASVKPGTISVASESPSASVAPGSITVVNSASPEHGNSSSAHAEESSSENHESKHDHSSSSSSEAKHEGLPPENSESNNGEERNDSDSGNRQGNVLPRIPVPLLRTRVRRIPPAATATVITTVARADPIIPARRTPRDPRSAPWMI